MGFKPLKKFARSIKKAFKSVANVVKKVWKTIKKYLAIILIVIAVILIAIFFWYALPAIVGSATWSGVLASSVGWLTVGGTTLTVAQVGLLAVGAMTVAFIVSKRDAARITNGVTEAVGETVASVTGMFSRSASSVADGFVKGLISTNTGKYVLIGGIVFLLFLLSR